MDANSEVSRLRAELQARTDELSDARDQQSATAEVLRVMSQSSSQLKDVLTTVVRSAVQLSKSVQGAIFLRRGDEFVVEAGFGLPGGFFEFLQAHPIKPGRETFTGRTALLGTVVHIPDVLADPEYHFPDAAQVGRYRAALGVPLLRDGAVEGVFALGRAHPEPYTERQIELVSTFADQAAIAVENARLSEEVQARTRELQESLERQTATSEVLETISSSTGDLDPVFQTILANATRICEGAFGTLYLREGDAFRAEVLHGAPPEFVKLLRREPLIRPSPNSGPGRVVRTHRPVQVADVISDPAYKEGDTLRKAALAGGVRSLLAVPMLKDKELIGAISIYRTEVRAFTDKQVELVTSFASQAVIAIENARLLNELRDALQQQTATSEVLKTISRSTFDLQTVLHTLVESAARLCDAEQASITRQRGGVFYRAEFYGFSEEFIAHARSIPIEPEPGSVTGRALLEGRTVHIPDVQADPEYTWVEARNLGGFRTILGVPMMREDAPIGVLTLSRVEPRPFTARQIELVSTFADQAAIAIENVRLFEQVQARTEELAESLQELRAAQDRLVETQKLAALGQLTAGVAHEIKNPLNFVNNFADLSAELIDEQREVLAAGRADALVEANELATMIKGNLEKVVQHGRRADSIVKNMLLHSRQGSGERREVEINPIAAESLQLAYHGARAENPSFNVRLTTALDPGAGAIDAYPQELARVLLNLISNSFHAVHKRQRESANPAYEPEVTISTRALADAVEVRVRDNGTGIPEDVRARMFDPFFTTKPPGEGTGLGLSLSHDIIVKQHGGRMDVDTRVGEFTEFVITLPRRAA